MNASAGSLRDCTDDDEGRQQRHEGQVDPGDDGPRPELVVSLPRAAARLRAEESECGAQ